MFFFKTVLAILGPLHFQKNFKLSLSVPVKTDEILIEIVLNL